MAHTGRCVPALAPSRDRRETTVATHTPGWTPSSSTEAAGERRCPWSDRAPTSVEPWLRLVRRVPWGGAEGALSLEPRVTAHMCFSLVFSVYAFRRVFIFLRK